MSSSNATALAPYLFDNPWGGASNFIDRTAKWIWSAPFQLVDGNPWFNATDGSKTTFTCAFYSPTSHAATVHIVIGNRAGGSLFFNDLPVDAVENYAKRPVNVITGTNRAGFDKGEREKNRRLPVWNFKQLFFTYRHDSF